MVKQHVYDGSGVAIVADLKKVKEAPTVVPEEGGMDDG